MRLSHVIFICCGLFIPIRHLVSQTLPPFQIAQKHNIRFDGPADDFFEGALLGNGGMGVVVSTRPDGVMIYFGHNNVWDIRIAEKHKKEIGTFQEIFDKVNRIPDTLATLNDDPWYAQYSSMAADNYSKPYPRPFPCGAVLLGFDRRKTELIGHTLNIGNGHCTVRLLDSAGNKIQLEVFTDMHQDNLWLKLVDEKGRPVSNIFDRIRIIPDPSTPEEFPKYSSYESLKDGTLSFRQVLPYQEPDAYDLAKGHPKDRAFSLTAVVDQPLQKTTRFNWDGNMEKMAALEAALMNDKPFTARISLTEGLSHDVPIKPDAHPVNESLYTGSRNRSLDSWREYWSKSGVALSDSFLEEIWYRNLYFFNCAAREGVHTPGLFANWSYNQIGTAWHSDYHMNYNLQQAFWTTFSSNHLEKNLPYVDLIEDLMGVSRDWAKNYYHLPGAYFPHSAYPVDMAMNSYPVPTWGWEICETPWAVQGLWWHYLYSHDTSFLRHRAYEPIREAIQFLVAYMKRPEAHGKPRWNDDKFHIFPTVPPELYGLRPGFQFNYDCSVDLTLTKFMFRAFLQMVDVLHSDDHPLAAEVQDILDHFPDYPTALANGKRILVSVTGEHSGVVYNVPVPLMAVFPGEDYGLGTNDSVMQVLKNTFINQRNEGGNDLVMLNLQAARIGVLDVEKFKRQVSYCLLPDGSATDMVMQSLGRYEDNSNYAFMAPMGVWFENFGLPAVINECLMQSYDGVIRLFPNWDRNKDASFDQLRAAGAFLVSATLKNGKVTRIKVVSEKGGTLKIISPWGKKGKLHHDGINVAINNELIQIPTRAGEVLTLAP